MRKLFISIVVILAFGNQVLTLAGEPNSTFGLQGRVITDLSITDYAKGGPIAMQPDGKVILTANQYDQFSVLRFFALI